MVTIQSFFESVNANAISDLSCAKLFTPRVFPQCTNAVRPVEALFLLALRQYDASTTAEESEKAVDILVALIARVEVLYRDDASYGYVSLQVMRAQRSAMKSRCGGGIMKYVRENARYRAATHREPRMFADENMFH